MDYILTNSSARLPTATQLLADDGGREGNMAYCTKCGSETKAEDGFCGKCGAKITTDKTDKKSEDPKPEDPKKEPVASETHAQSSQSNTRPGGGLGACGAVAITCSVLIVIVAILGFFALAFLGAKGQPGTVLKPTDVKTPQNLTAKEADSAISLEWKKSDSANIAKYNVYKSTKNAQDYSKLATVENAGLTYKDTAVTKGVTYYYVTTAVNSDGKESGNSNQASFALTPPPLVPQGITSWQDVLEKYNADAKYADVLTKVTKLTKSDIEKYVSLEAKGKKLKTTLKKGTIITNTTENYKIIPNFVLNTDKEFLTDDKGVPQIMMWCGNPIKLISKVTWVSEMVQIVQNITYNIIYIFPAPITNIFIYAGTPISTAMTNIWPTAFGSTMMNPNIIYVDPAWPTDDILTDTSANLGATATGQPLKEGQKWAVEGKILLEANPADPAAGESVTMKIKLSSGQQGVALKYSVSGTDGYSASGDLTTDTNGEASFIIPGGPEGTVDTIKVIVPDQNLEGETSYTF